MFDTLGRAKPVLKWAGGKSGVLPRLIELFPPKFNRYIEPFFGGGAVYFSLKKGVPAIINDSNIDLGTLYEVIRDQPKDLIRALDRLAERYSERFFYEFRSTRPQEKVAIAARLVFLNKTCFNGLYRENSKGEFNVSFGKRVKCPALYELMNLMDVSERLKTAEHYCGDFEHVLNKAEAGDLVYCDPPYEPISVTSSFQSYTPNRFSLQQQERLRDLSIAAANRGAAVFISGSTAPQITHLFQSHDVALLKARRAINSKGNSRGEIGELVVRILTSGGEYLASKKTRQKTARA